MSLTITPAMRALLNQRSHRFAKLWQVRRTDGEVLRFTSHNRTITFGGFDYIPTGGGSLSAERRQGGLEDSNASFLGVLTDDAITFDDLWAGRYRETEITQYKVDWRYPFAGSFAISRRWITDTEFDGEVWTAQLSSFPMWLRFQVGDVHGRTCGLTLYEPNCGVSQGAYAAANNSAEVTTIVTPRLKFNVTNWDNSQSNDYFNGGHLIWYTGANAGVKSQIKTYINSPRSVELELRTPFDIVDGDTFNAWRGCNKLGRTGDCKLVFNNMVNFDGYQDMPGTDQMIQTQTK